MKVKSRILSLLLALLMFTSVLAAFPPIEVKAADNSSNQGFDFSDFWYSKEIELGDNLEWSGYIELDGELDGNGWEIIDVSISIKHPDGSAIYYRKNNIYDWEFDTTEIKGGDIPTDRKAPNGQHPDDNGGYYEVNNFIIDEPGTYKLFVNVYAKNNTSSKFCKEEYEFKVLPKTISTDPGFDFSGFWCSNEVKLGEDLKWGGYVELSEDGWEIVDVSISIEHPNGSAIYYRETDVWDWYFYTEDIQGGCIPTNKTAPEGWHPNNSGDYYEVDDFIIDEPGTYKLFVNVSAESDNGSDWDNQEYEFEVLPASTPKILDITASSSSVRVAEDIVFTVTTNDTVNGIAFFVDSNKNFIGSIENTNGKLTHSFTFRFSKTSKEDSNGNDVTNKRTIYAYPIDKNGDVLLDAGLVYCSVTVNPAKYNFDDFKLNSAQTIDGSVVTITWDTVTAKNGATVCYNLWIDNELVAENLTKNSYTLTAAQVNRLGVGSYGTMVMATAYQHRQKQAESGFTIYPIGHVIVYPGDVNGDGKTDGTDVTKLKKYLANYDETDPAKQSVVDPVGADVNGDGKINGKDLNALYIKLENGNIEIPEPEPEPDIPVTLPVKHTYTVKIPLDKADLKATTGRTIYLMPKYGYVKLVAYDETGKEVKLNQAGIIVDVSNANGVVTFDGFTLKAVKGGYGVISYTQMVNGKKTTTEIAIHVGEASVASSNWPSSYQYATEDYEYVSMCLDLIYSLNYADVPDYDELEMGLGDEILEGMGDWKDRLSNILQNEWNFETQIIKESIALFIDYYADELEDIMKKNNDDAKKDANNITDLLEEIYHASDEIDKSIGGVVDLIDSISDMRENQVTIEKIAQLQAQVEWMYENGNLKKMFDSSPRLKAYQASKEISLKQLTEKLANTKKISGRLDIDVVGVGLDFFKGVVYITNDYSNNIKLLEMLKKQIVSEVDANSPEMEAIAELIDEYNNKALTAMDEFFASLVINGFESTILKHPAFAIFDLATLIVNEINHTEEKTNLRNLIFYHTALGGVIDNASLKMYNEGLFMTTLADMKFASNIYFYLLIFENEIALTAVDKENIEQVNAEIAEIKSMFEYYLNYSILA